MVILEYCNSIDIYLAHFFQSRLAQENNDRTETEGIEKMEFPIGSVV